MTRTRAGLLVVPALVAIGIWWSQSPAPASDPAAPEPPAEAQEPPLPRPEVFVARDDLTVSVLTDTPVIRLGERLRLTLRFRNEGADPLLILPPRHPLPTPLSWRDPEVRPPDRLRFEGARPRAITHADLVALAPGETWDMPLQSQELAQPIALAPGVHEIGVTYANYPDYTSDQYDPYSMSSNIWEGMVAGGPARITIEPPLPETVARWRHSLASDLPDPLELELLALSGPEGVAALIDRIRTAGGDRAGHAAVRALGAVEHLPAQAVIDALTAAEWRDPHRLQNAAHVLLSSRPAVDCALLAPLVVRLDLPGSDVFAPGVAACPSLAPSLRAILLDPERAHTTRANAARLLSLHRDASDVPLLIDALEGRLAAPAPPPGYAVAIHMGAAAGLALFPDEPEAIAALVRVLANEPQNSALRRAAVWALSAIEHPAAVPPFIDLLSSPDPALVVSAVNGLASLRASDAVPRLMELLRDRNPRLRMSAASALRTIDDPSAREAMVTALDDADSDVRMYALLYLVEHGDETLRDRAVHALQHARERNVREAAAEVLTRFGTEEDVARIRQLVEVVDHPDVRGSLASALGRLTFVAETTSGNLAEWDAWYEDHRDATRVAWALDGLRRAGESPFPASHFSLWPAEIALPYLARLDDARAIDAIEGAANSRRWGVRVEAARAIATFDRPRGMRLLIREFTGRSYEACVAVHWTLNRLAGEQRDLDCRSPAARAAAAAEWTAAIR